MSVEDALLRASNALQEGRWEDALIWARKALSQAPNNSAAHHLIGIAQLQSGLAQDAVISLETARSGDRHNPGLLGHLGHAYAACGQHTESHDAFRRAERLAPGHWPYRLGAAIALAQLGREAEAESLLQRLHQRHPEVAIILFNLGTVQLQLGHSADAARSLRSALELAPDDAEIHSCLGTALHRQLQFGPATTHYRRAIALQPQWPVPRLNLVSALIDDGHFDAATKECRDLIALAPDIPEAHRFLGAALNHQGRLHEALAAFKACATLKPEDAASLRSLGGALAECGQWHAASRTLARAEALSPDDPAMSPLRSMVALAAGQLTEGWAAYRSRPAYAGLAPKWPHPRLTQTLPADIRGLHVLVRREQGLGDELFFLRQLPRLRQRGATVSVCVSTVIAEMIRRSAVADAVLAGDADAPEDIDAQIFCGDLAHALDPSHASALPIREIMDCVLPDYSTAIRVFEPSPAPPLVLPATPEALARMQQRLRDAGPPPYLALTWRAGTAARDQGGGGWLLSKHIEPQALAHALRGHRGSLIAVQRHPVPGELQSLAETCGRALADFTDVNDNLEDMLALMHLVDDYVGVSNTNMHLRAATGRSARVMVPNPAEWRWMQWGRYSPWFPGFVIYRQSLDGQWSVALAQLAHDLAAV